MLILVDADACPVKPEILAAAAEFGVGVVFVAALQHAPREVFHPGFESAPPKRQTNQHPPQSAAPPPPVVEYLIVERHPEAVDITLMNRANPGDIVVTQDFGLASVVVQKGAHALSPEGRVYRLENIDELLDRRHETRVLKHRRGRTAKLGRKPPFTAAMRARFLATLRRLLSTTTSS
ncbi:MAG: YaiI/YqxD family protein [Candidatus Sumerlaeia bacterium]